MRTALAFVFALISSGIFAQITITSADMPSIDSTYTLSNAGLFNDYDFAETGYDFTWDFSELEPTGDVPQNFIPVSDAPFSYQFLFNNPFDQAHVADFALNTDGFEISGISLDDFYQFYQNDNEAFTIVGYGATVNSIPVPGQTNPVDDVYLFPLDYADVHEGYSEWEISIPTLAYYKLEQTRSYTVDGWGSLTTPAGTYDALRVTMEIESHDSIYIELIQQGVTFDRTSTEYHWLANEEGVPVLRVVETLGQTSQIQYKVASEEPDFVEELNQTIKVYPNPTNGLVYLSSAFAENEVSLFNTTGQLLKTWKNVGVIDLEAFAAGNYLLQVTQGNSIQTQRIILE